MNRDPTPATRHAPRLPERLSPTFGLDDAIDRLATQLGKHRFVTITGPGGLGKTTLATAFARKVEQQHGTGVCFVDLSPIDHPGLVPRAIAAALGLPQSVESVATALSLAMADAPFLVVLDSCEHLLQAVAEAAEAMLASTAGVQVLTTSRERLGATGEQVHALAPMALPPVIWPSPAAEAITYPAIQLFVERARAAVDDFALLDVDARTAVEICRQLDGIPLAIELAAARVGRLGLRELARQLALDGVLHLDEPTTQRPARHHTLGAMLDWSYGLLTRAEQGALARLSIFRGQFTLDAALSLIAGDANADEADAPTILMDLVAKSLVSVTRTDNTQRYRLLDVTRAYAAAKLRQGDLHGARRRHAHLMLELLAEAEARWESMNRREWTHAYSPWLDDIRAAIDWCFSERGDVRLGIELTIRVYGLADHVGLMFEFEGKATHALAMLRRTQVDDPMLEARLLCAFPRIVHWEDAASDRRDLSKLHQALALVQRCGQPQHLVKPLMCLWVEALHAGDYPSAVRWTEEMAAASQAPGDPMALLSSRVLSMSLHLDGQHPRARDMARFVREHGGHKLPFAYAPTAMDGAVTSRIVLARDAWLCGRADQAVDIASEALHLAGRDNPFSECQTMTLATIPISLWRGDTVLAGHWIERLRVLSSTYALAYYGLWCTAYASVLSHWQEHGMPRLASPRPAVAFKDEHLPLLRDHLRSFDGRMRHPGDLARASAATAGWCQPEILRVHAQDTAGTQAPRVSLARAMLQAREQGALAWELRSAVSLAHCHHTQDRSTLARDTLAPVLDRFTEGHGTSDVAQARSLLREIGSQAA